MQKERYFASIGLLHTVRACLNEDLHLRAGNSTLLAEMEISLIILELSTPDFNVLCKFGNEVCVFDATQKRLSGD